MLRPSETLTVEQIAKHYSAAMDSVNLINKITSKPTKTEQDVKAVVRNTEHLKIMLGKTFWTTQDLTPLHTAANVAVTSTTT